MYAAALIHKNIVSTVQIWRCCTVTNKANERTSADSAHVCNQRVRSEIVRSDHQARPGKDESTGVDLTGANALILLGESSLAAKLGKHYSANPTERQRGRNRVTLYPPIAGWSLL